MMLAMSNRDFIGKMIFVTSGLLIWAVHFTIIYGFTTVACVKGFATANVLGIGAVQFLIGAATLLGLATTGFVLRSALAGPVRPRSARYSEITERFLQYIAAAIAALSFVAIAWNALPVLVVMPC